MRIYFMMLFVIWISVPVSAQSKDIVKDTLPYFQIPDYPDDYSAGNVVARMVDGLGYRYFWATQGLRTDDLVYRPTPEAASTEETIEHLYRLSGTILNATASSPNIRPLEKEAISFADKRAKTLKNLKAAADNLRGKSSKEMEAMKLIFQRNEQSSEYPFWNNINGPIADAIYHTGQIVSFRRTTGNPVHPGMNVFIGKTRE